MQIFMTQEANYVSYLCIVHVRAVEEKIDSLVCREEGHRLEKLQAPPMRNESISPRQGQGFLQRGDLSRKKEAGSVPSRSIGIIILQDRRSKP